MKGNKILVTAHPKGNFGECIIVGTPKPGTIMEIDSGVSPVAGTFSWQAAGTNTGANGDMAADGDKTIIAVLLEDKNQGKIYSDAYAAGDRGFLYFPIPGDEFNLLLQNEEGTGEAVAIGDFLMVDDGTGKVMEADNNAESQPFVALEAVSAITADTPIHCMYTGH